MKEINLEDVVLDNKILCYDINRILDNLILELGLNLPTGDWDKL